MNFGSLKQFLEFKTIENKLKFAAQCWAKIGPRLQCAARRPATHGRLEGWLGHVLAARSWLAGGKVLGLSIMAEQRMRRARGAEAGLIDEVARRRGGAAVCDGVLTRGRVSGDSG
jgi:hypothetical protein